MKKYLSVIMLYNKMIFKGTLLAMLLMLVGETGLFCFLGGFSAASFCTALDDEMLYIVFCVCMLVLVVFSAFHSDKNSKPVYTYLRLNISEREVFFCDMVVYMINFFLLWVMQLIVVLLLAYMYQNGAGYHSGLQGIVLDFYRNDFLHGMYPMDDWLVAVKDIVLLSSVSAGYALSHMSDRSKMLGNRSQITNFFSTLSVVWPIIFIHSEDGFPVVLPMVIDLILVIIDLIYVMAIAHKGERMVDHDES